jgi:hypothetical protein
MKEVDVLSDRIDKLLDGVERLVTTKNEALMKVGSDA